MCECPFIVDFEGVEMLMIQKNHIRQSLDNKF